MKFAQGHITGSQMRAVMSEVFAMQCMNAAAGLLAQNPMSRRNDGFNGNPNLYNGYANQPYTPSYGYGYEEPSVTPGGNWNMSGITLNNNPQSINPNAGYFGFWNPRYGRG